MIFRFEVKDINIWKKYFKIFEYKNIGFYLWTYHPELSILQNILVNFTLGIIVYNPKLEKVKGQWD